MIDVRITTIIEWKDETGSARRHDLRDGSMLQSPGAVQGFVGRIVGPSHTPYWLRTDGTVSKAAVTA